MHFFKFLVSIKLRKCTEHSLRIHFGCWQVDNSPNQCLLQIERNVFGSFTLKTTKRFYFCCMSFCLTSGIQSSDLSIERERLVFGTVLRSTHPPTPQNNQFLETKLVSQYPWSLMLLANSSLFQNQWMHAGEHSPAVHAETSIQYLERFSLWSKVERRQTK